MQKTIGERINFVIKSKKLSANSFADLIGENSSKVYQIIKNQVSTNVKVLTSINRAFPDVNIDYIVAGRGEPFLDIKQGLTEAEIMEPVSALREQQSAYGDYKEMYEQCRELVAAKELLIKSKDEIIDMQRQQLQQREK